MSERTPPVESGRVARRRRRADIRARHANGAAASRYRSLLRESLDRLGIPEPALLRRAGAMLLAGLVVGMASLGSGPDTGATDRSAAAWRSVVRSQIQAELKAGSEAVLNDRITRLDRIVTFSARFGIPADLSSEIYDAAEAEGLEPELAFALVRVESSFRPRVVSPVGAVGLTQVLPSTAIWVDPGLDRTDLFRRGTNLRVGFRYLRGLIDRYDGDVRTALLAYNRGPTRVDSLQSRGVDPANGYARAVLELAVP